MKHWVILYTKVGINKYHLSQMKDEDLGLSVKKKKKKKKKYDYSN